MQLLLFLLLLCICPVSNAEEIRSFALTTSSEAVVLMEDADAESEPVAVCESDVWVLRISEEEDWVLVQTQDGVVGYIQKSNLEIVNISYQLYGFVRNPNEKEFLNLRESPSLRANILGTYYNGVPCLILSHDAEGWYKVRIDGKEGFFREEYIQEKTVPYGEETATVNSRGQRGVNMRSGPGYLYPATRLCAENSYLTVIRKGKSWWMVSDEGNVGFIRSDLLIEGIVNPVFQDESVTGATAIVNNPKATQVLNMREKPTRFSNSLAQYSNGTVFTLLQQGMEWSRVSDNHGNTGWCMTQYLTLKGASSVPTKTVEHPDQTFVNLRVGPSTVAGAVIDQVPHGSVVTVLIPDLDGWTYVEYEGQAGYMLSVFLQ